jgi:hypothetical protein
VPEVPEYVVNVKLAEILSQELGIDCRSERVEHRMRPDIRCYYRGLIIGIEASYVERDAELDAEARIRQGLVDLALALRIRERFRDIPEPELKERVRRARYGVRVFVPRDVAGTLIPFIAKAIKMEVEPATGWFEEVDLPTIKAIIENSASFLAREEEVHELVKEMRQKISDFTETLCEIDTGRAIRRSIYGVLYRLYGLSVAETKDPDVAFGHAGLSILLSTVFYEHIRSVHPQLRPVMEHVKQLGPIQGLMRALEDLLRIDYKTAVETTIEILRCLPLNIANRIRGLIELGVKIASSRGLLRRDFAGRVYHEITGDIALRKGFATFYTEVPAAHLLASLATETLLDIDRRSLLSLGSEEARRLVERIRELKVGDFACGSGTLLTASYYSLQRITTALKYYYDLENVDLDEVGRTLIERGIYGIDALRYASQITAINLALMAPSTISRENVYTIYLGYIPEKNQAWLGSLELLNNGTRVGGLLAWIEGGLKGLADRVSLEGTEGAFQIPSRFDIVIMNPPFTRATGRTESFEEESAGGRGLFGFIAGESARKKLLEAYNNVREYVRSDLVGIARSLAPFLPSSIKDIVQGEGGLRQYLSIGQAGEGLLFLYLAYRYVGNGGVIAFVLPRGVLAGISWFLARTLLASKFHVEYVIVSSDPRRGYNFSEGTSLSETLIVAKRVEKHSDNEETVFVNLLSKPSTALEAMMLAEEIKKSMMQRNRDIVEVGDSRALIFKVGRRQLLNNVDNWNRFVATSDPELLDVVMKLFNGVVEVGGHRIEIPITRLNDILLSISIDRHQFHDNFSSVSTATPYPIVYGGEEKVRKRMLIKPNAYAHPKTDRARDIFRDHCGKVLVPDRIRWNTAHIIALYSTEPVLSNIFYAVRLRVADKVRESAEKSLVLWFNTTWGLLTVLINRQETWGAWSGLKMSQWRLQPVLDVANLDHERLKRLAEVFDNYAGKFPRRIPDQFDPKNPDEVRLGIDIGFLKAFDPNIDEKEARKELLELYRHVHTALQLWVGE